MEEQGRKIVSNAISPPLKEEKGPSTAAEIGGVLAGSVGVPPGIVTNRKGGVNTPQQALDASTGQFIPPPIKSAVRLAGVGIKALNPPARPQKGVEPLGVQALQALPAGTVGVGTARKAKDLYDIIQNRKK